MGIFSFFSRKKAELVIKPKKDELSYLMVYEYSDTYSTNTSSKPTTIELMRNSDFKGLIIKTLFNDKHYPMFDIDDIDKFNHFMKHTNYNGVVFQSSPGHHWVIIDKQFDSVYDFLKDDLKLDWICYSHDKYNDMVTEQKYFCLRGLFDNMNRQPFVLQTFGNLTNDFKIYIDKLEKHFQVDSLELSTLRYKEPEMLLQLRRIKKLERITKN